MLEDSHLMKNRTLSRLLEKLTFNPGLNAHIFQQLEHTVSRIKSRQDKVCALIFDEMSLSTNLKYDQVADKNIGVEDDGSERKARLVDHANVFFLKGLYRQYKQPLAFTFSRGPNTSITLKDLIKKLIGECQKIGLNVMATICDQGTNNQAAIKLLIQERKAFCLEMGVDDNYFGFLINNKEVVPLFDTPHLFKGWRNNLLVEEAHFFLNGEKKIAKWSHIEQFYHLNLSDQTLRIKNKLTDVHVIPEKINKMKVKLCIQVFSHRVNDENKDTALKYFLLGCTEFHERHTAENVSNLFNETIHWGIANKITEIITGNAANIAAAIHSTTWRHFPCFAHTLNLTVQHSLDAINEQLHKVKAIVQYFKHSSSSCIRLTAIQKQMNLPILELNQSVVKRWNSTYGMLDRLLKIKDAVVSALVIEQPRLNTLTHDEWTLLEKCVEILKICYEVTVDMSTEKSVSISKVMVLVKIMKTQVERAISQSIENNTLAIEAALLDPRFKKHAFLHKEKYHQCLNSIKKKLRSLFVDEEPPPIPQTSSQSTNVNVWAEFEKEIEKEMVRNPTAASTVCTDPEMQEVSMEIDHAQEPIHKDSNEPLEIEEFQGTCLVVNNEERPVIESSGKSLLRQLRVSKYNLSQRERILFNLLKKSKRRYNMVSNKFYKFKTRMNEAKKFMERNLFGKLAAFVNQSGNAVLADLSPNSLKRKLICSKHFNEIFTQSTKLPLNAEPFRYISDESSGSESDTENSDNPIAHMNVVPVTKTYPGPSKKNSSGRNYHMEIDLISSDGSLHEQEDENWLRDLYNLPTKSIGSEKKNRLLEEENKRLRLELENSRKKLNNTKVQLRNAKKKIMNAEHHTKTFGEASITGFAKSLINMQVRHRAKSPWQASEKRDALSLFYRGPKTYRYLRQKGINLPGISTLKSWINNFNCKPGFNKKIFLQLSLKADSMMPREKKCILMFDEMSIKRNIDYNKHTDMIEGFEDLGEFGRKSSPASQALVLMIRGIYSTWKIPIAFFVSEDGVSCESLLLIIKKALEKLRGSKLDTIGIVCDLSSTNKKMFKQLGVEKTKPYFHLNERKYFAFFDVPHLIKSVRNNFINTNLILNEKYICFSDIKQVYDIDKKSSTGKALLKLTDKHLNPNSFQKMNVKLATQLLSHSVYAALMTSSRTGSLYYGTSLMNNL
ncbi:uncharacterized protein LOC123683025 [Harmonia axyridis]|uniref:uncharacterized protein LOC123683025 n=1 Tax=Harmonia axyridis TaxID=115357 RepID=UPI001E276102|nr:uncharacterized protein LOC123683025 [Harmonia axyridis]